MLVEGLYRLRGIDFQKVATKNSIRAKLKARSKEITLKSNKLWYTHLAAFHPDFMLFVDDLFTTESFA